MMSGLFFDGFNILLVSSMAAYLFVINQIVKAKFDTGSIHYFLGYFFLGVLGFSYTWYSSYFNISLNFIIPVAFFIISMGVLSLAIRCYLGSLEHSKFHFGLSIVFLPLPFIFSATSSLMLIEAAVTFVFIPPVAYLTVTTTLKQKNFGLSVLVVGLLLIILMASLQLVAVWYDSINLLVPYIYIGHASSFLFIGLGLLTSLLIKETQKFQQLALIDPLTRIYNRRGLGEVFSTLFEQKTNQQKVLLGIVMDIDHFKRVNDTYGHLCGDIVIEKLADILRSSTRKSDLCCRLGGEEFLLLVVVNNQEEGLTIAEKLRQNIESQTICCSEATMTFTASFGIAKWTDNDTLDELIKRADIALYQAKEAGRNKIVVYID